jgi:hypothetical protein
VLVGLRRSVHDSRHRHGIDIGRDDVFDHYD